MRFQNGSLFLFRLFGIPVFLHWTWFIVAMIEFQNRKGMYSNPIWNALEYMTLFGIVLMHEFGHSLACKSVGGKVMEITLWPLGGVARVAPPQRAGAYLWSIAAGPLVNVILVPITVLLYLFLESRLGPTSDVLRFAFTIAVINVGLLIFNVLPIFPLDGGQILRGVLWLMIGAGRSLMIAAWIGLIVSISGIVVFLMIDKLWLVIMSAFALFQSFNGIRVAKMIRAVESLPTNMWFACPGCGKHPPMAPLWRCGCGAPMDPFTSQGLCGQCGKAVESIACPHCHESFPAMFWMPRKM
jgi:Zn-dependent protease